MSEKIRVVLADDHAVVLQGLRGLLEQEEDLQVVVQGRIIFPAAAQRWFMNQPRQETEKAPNTLSVREWEVIECTAKGMTNPEIAQSLGVSANTVRFHLKSIFSKIQVSNRTEAAAWYLRS